MMDMNEIFKKISELENSGMYTQEQMAYIKYALYRDDFDVNLILDSSIPSEYMGIYIKLGVGMKNIPIEKYIKEKWHNLGYTSQQLYYIIYADSQNINVKNIPLNMSVEDIKAIINQKQNDRFLEEEYKKANLSLEDLEKIKKLNISYEVKKFLLRISNSYDISVLLDIGLENYSFEQVKYLASVLSTGIDISIITNPNLSVEQMRQKVLNSAESLDFISQIRSLHDNRKK